MSSEFGQWWLAVAAMMLLYLSLTYRPNKYFGLLFGLAFLGVHLQWIATLGISAWLGLLIVAALPWAIISLFPAKNLTPAIFAAVVVAVETIRSAQPFGGFPWGLLAYTQLDGPVVYVAQLGGQGLVSGVVAYASAMLVSTIKHRKLELVPFTIIAILLITPLFANTTKTTGSLEVAAVQGNVPRAGLDAMAQRRQVLNNHLEVTRAFANTAQDPPDLVIWPENASDIDPYQDSEAFQDIQRVVDLLDVPVLVGAITHDLKTGQPENVGLLWQGSGPTLVYQKQQLVPFGEYIPSRQLLAGLSSELSRIPRDFQPGNNPGTFAVANHKVGEVICFEIAFDELVRELVQNDSEIFVVQTNNSTYGFTSQPKQQLAITRFRAIEHQRATIVAATSGVSALIEPSGKVIAQSQEFTAEVLTGKLETRTGLTLSNYFALPIQWLAVGFVIWHFTKISRIGRRLGE